MEVLDMARQNFEETCKWNKVIMSSNDDTLIQDVGNPLLLAVKSSDVAPVELETGLILNITESITIPSTKFVFIKGKCEGLRLEVEVV